MHTIRVGVLVLTVKNVAFGMLHRHDRARNMRVKGSDLSVRLVKPTLGHVNESMLGSAQGINLGSQVGAAAGKGPHDTAVSCGGWGDELA